MPMIKKQKLQNDANMDLLTSLQQAVSSGRLKSNEDILTALQQSQSRDSCTKRALDKFITVDPLMLKMKERIMLIHMRSEPVLITGPTGTGKELLARALTIPGQPFVAENCAAIPENLVESVFFGHKKGAFTGAHSDHTGLLQDAGEGIIFLDEIGDMPLPLQAKFLRAIQENEIRPVGEVEPREINCRFVAATRYDLEELVAQRRFREDLYARLSVYELQVTGLKDRTCDVYPIRNSLVPAPDDLPEFPETVLHKINKYNVRAIQTAIHRWFAYGCYE